MGTLYLVATPIGNLEDLSPRAARLLGEVRLIAAEDTRHTLHLLHHLNIRTPLLSYHEHNKLSRLDDVLSALAEGDVALVSDAGTPALNDPGYELVRAALAAGFPVSPIPGPSAPVAALVASGLPTDSFVYLGYLPRKHSERMRLLEGVRGLSYTLIFLETPHRLLESLADLQTALGDRDCAAGREITKLHEEFVRGKLSEVRAHFEAQAPRGEFTLVVGGQNEASAAELPWNEERLEQAIHQGLAKGTPPSQLASELSRLAGLKRGEVYPRIVAARKTPHQGN